MSLSIHDLELQCEDCGLGSASMTIEKRMFIERNNNRLYAFFYECPQCEVTELFTLPINQQPIDKERYREVEQL